MTMTEAPGAAATRTQTRTSDARVEAVTATFVAAGSPPGVHDLGRFLENLNNPTLSRFIELDDASLRPLYRAGIPVMLDAPVVVGREEIVFANFEGPYYTRGTVKPAQSEAPVLLLAPPFQIKGAVSLPLGADAGAGVRSAIRGFFLVSNAEVFDAEGNPLGEGEQIIVNAARVQMASATRLHIPAVQRRPAARRIAGVEPEAVAPVETEVSRAA